MTAEALTDKEEHSTQLNHLQASVESELEHYYAL